MSKRTFTRRLIWWPRKSNNNSGNAITSTRLVSTTWPLEQSECGRRRTFEVVEGWAGFMEREINGREARGKGGGRCRKNFKLGRRVCRGFRNSRSRLNISYAGARWRRLAARQM